MFVTFGFVSIGNRDGESGHKTSNTVYPRPSAGIPSVRSAASKEISSDSVLEFEIEPSFLQNQPIGTYVFGPIKHKIAPDVLLLSPSHEAKEASANIAS